MSDVFRMAGQNIRILPLHPEVLEYCRDYRFDGPPDFTVSTTGADIERERERAARTELAEGRAVGRHSDAYLEQLAVYREIAERMPDFDTMLIHGSAVAVDGAAYLFTAKSGTGKSTHARLWRALLGERAVPVNDDKPLVRVTKDNAVACGTPWNGKHRLGNNICVPLRAICLLERSPENHIRPITPAEALPAMLSSVYRPADPDALRRTMALIDRLLRRVQVYRLGCNMDIGAAALAYEAMRP